MAKLHRCPRLTHGARRFDRQELGGEVKNRYDVSDARAQDRGGSARGLHLFVAGPSEDLVIAFTEALDRTRIGLVISVVLLAAVLIAYGWKRPKVEYGH